MYMCIYIYIYIQMYVCIYIYIYIQLTTVAASAATEPDKALRLAASA